VKYTTDVHLVETIPERCRVCYTCVRECPAKAIRVVDGQAQVIPQRCIGCGNCVRVCTQRAKRVLDCATVFRGLLAKGRRIAVCLAPSFPAEFADIPWQTLVGMIRGLGVESVHEVAFGADLVARAYARLVGERPSSAGSWIATTCPAVVAYVERHHPELVERLAPIVSPMVAMARVIHRLRGDDVRVVFVGPCVAKKGEVLTENLVGEVAVAITYQELRELFAERGIGPEETAPSDFDPPHAGLGGLFPISRGMLQAAAMEENLLEGTVAVADGRSDFVDALREFADGKLSAKLLEVLACQGCIMGPAVTDGAAYFTRRRRVREYVRTVMAERSADDLARSYESLDDLDLHRTYTPLDQRLPRLQDAEVLSILASMGKFEPADELNCGACGYETCREHAVAIHLGLAETAMCLPHTIEHLKRSVKELELSHQELAQAQSALLHSEKLASMGQLAAGIAHEVNNPLGVVLMYAHLLADETGIDGTLRDDLRMIVEQADRCKKIVAGLLHFSRQNKVFRRKVSLRDLVNHALKAAAPPAGVVVDLSFDAADDGAELDPDQIVQVLTNLLSNAYDAMPHGGRLGVRTTDTPSDVKFTVRDDGVGIAEGNIKKLFAPFFTTKQMGRGTGLGLAVTYGIVKMHGGTITVVSNDLPAKGPTGTTFIVSRPRTGNEATACH